MLRWCCCCAREQFWRVAVLKGKRGWKEEPSSVACGGAQHCSLLPAAAPAAAATAAAAATNGGGNRATIAVQCTRHCQCCPRPICSGAACFVGCVTSGLYYSRTATFACDGALLQAILCCSVLVVLWGVCVVSGTITLSPGFATASWWHHPQFTPSTILCYGALLAGSVHRTLHPAACIFMVLCCSGHCTFMSQCNGRLSRQGDPLCSCQVIRVWLTVAVLSE